MMPVPVRRLFCTVAFAVVVLECVFASGPVCAQSLMYGKTTVGAPERTDAGDWYGTWYFISRMRKMAVWMRDNDGKPELKLRVQALQSQFAENFTTGWDGSAEYDSRGQHGSFKMTFEQRDTNTIRGSWVWEVNGEERGRTETVDFTIYRAGQGRQMVWKLADIRQVYRGGPQEKTTEQKELVLSFQKASRREVLWGELPF